MLLVFASVTNHLRAFAEDGKHGVWIPDVLNAAFEVDKDGEDKQDDAAFGDAALWRQNVPQTDEGIDEPGLCCDVFCVKGVECFDGSVATKCANGKKVHKRGRITTARLHHGGANRRDARSETLDAHVFQKRANNTGNYAICFAGF